MGVVDQEGNLSADTQAPRLKAGIVVLGVGLTMAALMLKQGASIPVRLLLFVPFFVAVQFLLGGLFNTCASLAERGMRDVGDGPEVIADRAELCAVRSLSRRVVLAGCAASVLATALFVFMP